MLFNEPSDESDIFFILGIPRHKHNFELGGMSPSGGYDLT
jgi:hypothetical protein